MHIVHIPDTSRFLQKFLQAQAQRPQEWNLPPSKAPHLPSLPTVVPRRCTGAEENKVKDESRAVS